MITDSKLRTPFLLTLAAAATIALASCGSATPSAPSGTAPTGDALPSASASGSPEATPGGAAASMEGALAAIALAERETGAVAYELDDEDDDGSWEVELAEGTTQVSVHVSGDGATVLSTERDDEVDGDDRAALDAAGISLADAIEAAAAEAGGAPLDETTFEDDGDGQAWQVKFDDELEVYVAVADGSILRVD
ncbi:PepSY domain-containing protein [Agrococcus sp. BE272]|uniref:PepSY domain-containing protein n=1 Tax=Agrococcus sp. BE272 TaxID=2817727 RepID=UPI002855C77C|nr:PepSY domain-containing protein [Agrococcus sp. BE272]MDR7233254.1 putative membrane protein YkoI [Agrococcus sp. BE272]